MTTPPGDSIARRVDVLERQFAHELSRVIGMIQSATATDTRDIRLARTATKTGDTYPSAPADTFWIEFLDGFFEDDSGDKAATYASRGIDDGAHAHNITEDYLDVGTVVFAMWQRGLNDEDDGEWWIQRAGSPSQPGLFLCRFSLDTNLVLGGTATATVEDCSDSVSQVFGSTITVEDWIGKFKGRIGWRGVAYKYVGDTGCNWTIVELEEQAEMVEITLTSAFSGTPSQASGVVSDHWQGEQPPAAVTVEDRCDLYAHLTAGDCVIASYDELDDVYVVVDGEQRPDAAEVCADTTDEATVTGYTNVAELRPFHELQVNKDTFLRLFVDDNDNLVGLISIDPSHDAHSVFWSDGSKVRWTRVPTIGKTITTGSELEAGDGPGWWKQHSSPDDGGGEWWLGSRMGAAVLHKIIIPRPDGTESPDIGAGSNLTIWATDDADSPSCFQTRWTEPGVEGDIELLDSNSEPVVFTYSDGVVIKIANGPTHSTDPGLDRLVPRTDPEDAVCVDTTEVNYDPCP